MNSIITMAIAMAPSILAILMVRMNRNTKTGKPAHVLRSEHVHPPKVLSNLLPIDKVDIRAMFKKWED